MSRRESPIHTKSYDLLKWLLPSTAKFPREQRFALARQIEDAAFGFHRAIVESSQGQRAALREADLHLTLLRTYLRLACDLRYYSLNQYEHAARLVDELERLVGGWKRVAAAPSTAPSALRGP